MARTLLSHLGRLAREARERVGVRQIDIATTAGVSHTTVSKFERAQAWPPDPERLLAAYEAETGVPARKLWRAAIDAFDDGR